MMTTIARVAARKDPLTSTTRLTREEDGVSHILLETSAAILLERGIATAAAVVSHPVVATVEAS